MATIRATRNKLGRRYQVYIRKHQHNLTRTFDTSADAKAWANAVESALANESTLRPFKPSDWMHQEAEAEKVPTQDDDHPEPSPQWTLGKALRHYAATVTITKKGEKQESVRLLKWQSHEIATTRLSQITPRQIQNHIEARQKAKKASTTIRNEVLLLSAVFNHAKKLPRLGENPPAWGLVDISNPVDSCTLPTQPPGRNRRLEEAHGDKAGEEARMLEALAAEKYGVKMMAIFIIAVETGMRLSEILDIRANQVKKSHTVTTIVRPDSKNGRPRHVVLSKRATELVDKLRENHKNNEHLILLGTDQVESQWRNARDKAGIKDLHFHDLRHEALSRMASKGLNLGELKAQSGHRTTSILANYLNALPSDVAKKLG
jgi:integrase